MAISKREKILAAFKTALLPTAGIGNRVFRSDPEAVTLENVPCIDLAWLNEQASPDTVPQLERTLSVQVSVLVRGDVPDLLADPIITDAHARIMADATLGGLAIDIRLDDASFDFVSADNSAGKLTHQYSVKFRHSYTDMTT